MTSIKELPKQERPREKLVELGARALSDQPIVECLQLLGQLRLLKGIGWPLYFLRFLHVSLSAHKYTAT